MMIAAAVMEVIRINEETLSAIVAALDHMLRYAGCIDFGRTRRGRHREVAS
jgi:hypothetical protein